MVASEAPLTMLVHRRGPGAGRRPRAPPGRAAARSPAPPGRVAQTSRAARASCPSARPARGSCRVSSTAQRAGDRAVPRGAPVNSSIRSWASRGLGTCQGVAATGSARSTPPRSASASSGSSAARQASRSRGPRARRSSRAARSTSPPGSPGPIWRRAKASRSSGSWVSRGAGPEVEREATSPPGWCRPRSCGWRAGRRSAAPRGRVPKGRGAACPGRGGRRRSGQSEASMRRPERRESVARRGSRDNVTLASRAMPSNPASLASRTIRSGPSSSGGRRRQASAIMEPQIALGLPAGTGGQQHGNASLLTGICTPV